MPSASAVVEIVRPDKMVMLSCCVAICAGVPESVTVTVNFEFPDAVGVPEIVPAPESSVRPAGKLPVVTDHERLPIPPLACRVELYGTPTEPADSKVVVIMRRLAMTMLNCAVADIGVEAESVT